MQALAAMLLLAGLPAAVPQSDARPPSPTPDLAMTAKKIFPFPIEVKTLPNGLRYVFVKFNSPGITAYYSLVRTGSRNEVEPGRSGFAHFFEHMMFRGTERFSMQDFDNLLASAGVANNAFTTNDFTAFHELGPTSRLPLIIELEADRFQHLSYSQDDFKTEAKAVLGEYNKNFSNPTEKLDEVLHDRAFTTHPYKHTTMGFKEDIQDMPNLYQYSLEFFHRWYTPDNVTLIVVGDFDHGKVEELIRSAYGGWQGKASSVAVPQEPKQTEPHAVHVSWSNPTQPRLMVTWHTPAARTDTLSSAIQNVLGPYLFGPTSPTFRDLVLDRQLVTNLELMYYDHRDPSLFGVLAVMKGSEAIPAVQHAIAAAISDLRDGKVDAKRLEDVKSNQKYGLLTSLDNPDTVALQLVFAIGPTGDPDALNLLFNHIEQLTPKDLAAFAKTYLVNTNETEASLTGAGSTPPPGFTEYAPHGKPTAQPDGGGR
jgi:zinc protease